MGVALALAIASSVSGCREREPPRAEVERRLDYLERALAAIRAESYRAQWNLFTTGQGVAVRPAGAMLPFAEHQRFAGWRGRISDPVTGRRVELAFRACLEAQLAADPELVSLALDLSRHDRDRERHDAGNIATDAELEAIVRGSGDRDRRREAWRARHRSGSRTALALVERLVRHRSRLAREVGYSDYYELWCDQQGLDPRAVDRLLAALERRTRGAALAAAQRIGSAQRDGIARPWDLDVAQREAFEDIESYLDAESMLARTRATFTDIGLALHDDGLTIDAELRPGRSQHYFAFPIRAPGDVRLLVTPARSLDAYRKTLHEMGHAVYYQRVSRDSLLERIPESGVWSEGWAKTFERLAYEPEWLVRYAGVPEVVAAQVRALVAADELRRVRLFLAEFELEREAYRQPDVDFGARAREVAERVTFVSWRDDAVALASNVHLATQPLASAEYLYARLIQAQIHAALRAKFGGIIAREEVGELLARVVLATGASRSMDEILIELTGKPLGLDDYMRHELGLESRADDR